MEKYISILKKSSFVRFCMVGVLNTIVGAGVMFALYNLAHMSYWFSSAANYVVGGVLSFFLNKYFTFSAKGDMGGQALRFALNVAVCYAVAYSLAKPLVYAALSEASVSVQDNISMMAGMVIYTLLNYMGQKFFAFRAKKDGKSV